MLPASPKIFNGREEEVKHITHTLLTSKPARIAVLGPEGVGKSSLALASLHQPEVASTFGVHRFYVSCELAECAKDLGSVLAKHFGLEHNNGKAVKSVVRHLIALETPIVLVLDGIDNCWRPHEKRGDVEDFLSLLADIHHLSLVVCSQPSSFYLAFRLMFLRKGDTPRR